MSTSISRRSLLASAGLAVGAGVLGARPAVSVEAPHDSGIPFRYCLNVATIRERAPGIVQQVDIAVQAGYSGIEPWIRDIEAYTAEGGSVSDLAKRIADGGLTVESAIGFANWIVDDDTQRQAGLEQARRDMDLLKQIGGTRIAAPPAGGTKERIDLFKAAERYRALLEVGASIGVVPQLEVWGFSASLSRLGECVFVAVESGHADACILPDVYHVYRGGSEFTGLNLLGAGAMHAFHVNDYPTDRPREQLTDADRVYPGDGKAPLDAILRGLRDIGFRGALSLELFNRDYWKQDPLEVARTGLEKTKAAVERALS